MSGSNPFRRKFSSDDTSIGHTLVQVEIAENVEQFSTSGPGTQRSRNGEVMYLDIPVADIL